ncbi:MAG TPA: alternative ribosome rescue aminoacyl-tRNA hydrolase ArfB [Vicinamibacteria bacterium]|nr:alternative ribosome rescue aminoacyl-tRNA hydrolase ArfB [Vicinamibacteria bacterium]
MPAPIRIGERVVVPASALTMKAVRSSGPGGQNVNKVASKVELRVDLARVDGLSPAQRDRLFALAEPRRDAEGLLVVTSQKTRDQSRNLDDAREKVRALVAKAMALPRRRRATRPTAASRAERRRLKARLSGRKRARGRVRAAED